MTKNLANTSPWNPSDEQMDRLLTDFFKQEVPVALSHEFSASVREMAAPLIEGRQAWPGTAVHLAGPVLMSADVHLPMARTELPRRSVAAKMTVAGTLAAVVVCLFVVTSANRSVPGSGESVTSRPDSALPSKTAASSDRDSLPEESTMLVSPGADQRQPGQTVLGSDGVTLEETEGVDLRPAALPLPKN